MLVDDEIPEEYNLTIVHLRWRKMFESNYADACLHDKPYKPSV
jgi:hypothetical protein